MGKKHEKCSNHIWNKEMMIELFKIVAFVELCLFEYYQRSHRRIATFPLEQCDAFFFNCFLPFSSLNEAGSSFHNMLRF